VGSRHARPGTRATDEPPALRPGETVADPCPCARHAPQALPSQAFALDPAPPRDISRDELLARDQSQREQIARLRAELSTLQRDLRRARRHLDHPDGPDGPDDPDDSGDMRRQE
jgi:hypothetical protein